MNKQSDLIPTLGKRFFAHAPYLGQTRMTEPVVYGSILVPLQGLNEVEQIVHKVVIDWEHQVIAIVAPLQHFAEKKGIPSAAVFCRTMRRKKQLHLVHKVCTLLSWLLGRSRRLRLVQSL